jgi:alpha-L-fucosidase
MDRRNFCKLLGTTAAVSGVRGWPQSSPTRDLDSAFNHYTQSYAEFCALPARERKFYKVSGKNIVADTLDDATWKATEWGEPPALPIAGPSWDGVPMESPIPNLAGVGPYKPTWDSLQQYEAPEWYQDAKFGIWAHWSPQCVPEASDWYARNMYIEGQDQYKFHLEHYGPQSRFGYKDLCAQWTLLNWEPEALMQRYKKAGARIFFALANHHDSFDTWNSHHQPWNASAIGPHRDVIGTWAAEAKKQNMRFGVTVHQARNWWWFQPSHGADKTGALAGVPYDAQTLASEGQHQWWQGLNPQQLYGVKHPFDALPDISYVKNFYDRTRDLIDQHQPDLLYFDNSLLPLGWAGMNIAAYFYNNNLATHQGKMEAVLNIKQVPDHLTKTVIADVERGSLDGIVKYPWQSETCIGDWHYNRALYEKPGEYGGYLTPRETVHWLIDTVSKNGVFILNIPGKPDGTLDSKEIAVLDGITAWMAINGEAIYETRPWKIYGEGPNAVKSGAFQGKSVQNLGVQDIRFTRNKANTVVYAHLLGWPAGPFTINALGLEANTQPGRVLNVELLGTQAKLRWKQKSNGLTIEPPTSYHPAVDLAAAFKITIAT